MGGAHVWQPSDRSNEIGNCAVSRTKLEKDIVKFQEAMSLIYTQHYQGISCTVRTLKDLPKARSH